MNKRLYDGFCSQCDSQFSMLVDRWIPKSKWLSCPNCTWGSVEFRCTSKNVKKIIININPETAGGGAPRAIHSSGTVSPLEGSIDGTIIVPN